MVSKRTTVMLSAVAELCLVIVCAPANGADAPWAATFPGSVTKVYKTVDDVKLKLHIFNPEGHRSSDDRPAIVFFFGGGFVGGDPKRFVPQCEYFSSRCMVAATAEYRVARRHKTTPYEAIADGATAVRWLRANAAELGIDPTRVAAGGASAGGNLVACLGVTKNLDDPSNDLSISSVPDTMVMFNPRVIFLQTPDIALAFREETHVRRYTAANGLLVDAFRERFALDGFLAIGLRHKHVVRCETALHDHLPAVFEVAQVTLAAVVGA